MKYIIDTNILSEMTKPQPNVGVSKWFVNTSDADKFISAISIGEIVLGIERLPDSAKKKKLALWLESVILKNFSERLLDINADVMTVWGKMSANFSRTLPIQDTLIAATALFYDMTVVTRNTKDFEDIADLKLFNPWQD